MKKLLILMLVLGTYAAEASAQFGTVVSKKITSNTMNVIKVRRDKTFYFAAGGQINTVLESHYKSIFGYEAALGYQWAMKRDTQFGSQLGIEAGITSRGWEYDQFYASNKATGMAVFVSPINYVYRMGLGASKSIWFEPHIGAFVAADVIEEYEPYNGFTYSLEGTGKIRTYTEHATVDAGINIGLRLWVAKRISFDLSWRQGFVPSYAEEKAKVQYNTYGAKSGYSYDKTYSEIKHSGMSGNLCFRIGVKINK